jgi:SAM-dependent methyltransferase
MECSTAYPITARIPRFVQGDGYVKNFSLEWTFNSDILDSITDSNEFASVLQKSFNAPLAQELAGKIVLDAGCGMGGYAEVALRFGATVFCVDLSYAVDAAYKNLHTHSNAHHIQADLFRLPLRPATFDIIYSFGVLHHTPDANSCFKTLVTFLKPGGKISIMLYASYNVPQIKMTEFFRTFARRMPRKLLFYLCFLSVPLYYFNRIPVVGPFVTRVLFPISLQPYWKRRVGNTFDRYSPEYQSYHTHSEVFRWFKEAGLEQIELTEHAGVSMIGTKPMSST